jgi:hypothetical protein
VSEELRVGITVVLILAFVFLVFFTSAPERVATMFLGPKNRRDLREWEKYTEQLLAEHQKTIIRLGSLETEIASVLPSMPAGFIHPMKRGIRFGYAYEQALRRKAEELGIIDSDTLDFEPEEPPGVSLVQATDSKPPSMWDGGKRATK